MPRTHRAMIAKKLAETTGLNYAQALQRVTAAHISGTISGPYDNLGILHAAAVLAGEYRSELARVASDPDGHSAHTELAPVPVSGSLLDLVARHRRVVIQAPHNTGGTTLISALHTMSRTAEMPSVWVYADQARTGAAFPIPHAPTVFLAPPLEAGMLQMLTMQFTGMRDFATDHARGAAAWNDRIVFLDTPDIDPFTTGNPRAGETDEAHDAGAFEDPEPTPTQLDNQVHALFRTVWTDFKYPATLVYLTRSESPALFTGERSDGGVEADTPMAAAADLLLRPVPATGPDESWTVTWASALTTAELDGFDTTGTMTLPWTEELHGRPAPVWQPATEAQQTSH